MKFNHSKLLGKRVSLGYTQEKLAEAMGINKSTLNGKLSGKSSFTTAEIDKICEILSISNKEIGLYFFSK
jgi:transcriptional regulator with XRE-family HTH domain